MPPLLLELVGAGHWHADGKSIGCQPSPLGVKVGQLLLDDDELLELELLDELLELELLDAEHPSPACINCGSRLLYVKRCSNPDAGAASPSEGTFVPPVPAFVSSLTPLELASAHVGHVSSGSHEQGLGGQEELLELELLDDELLELEPLDELLELELLDELLEEKSPDELRNYCLTVSNCSNCLTMNWSCWTTIPPMNCSRKSLSCWRRNPQMNCWKTNCS